MWERATVGDSICVKDSVQKHMCVHVCVKFLCVNTLMTLMCKRFRASKCLFVPWAQFFSVSKTLCVKALVHKKIRSNIPVCVDL